jgi:hypothetical protein
MKGPGMRLELDVRRVWRCPACGRETRSDVKEVARVCSCTKEGVAMRLVELPRPKPVVRLPEPPDPDIPELADFPTDIPVNPPAKRPPVENHESRQFPEIDENEAESTNTDA